MAGAISYFDEKLVYPDGAILQLRIWQVPQPVRGSTHGFKYSLFYGRPGLRIVAYDNEAGKGDHVHRFNTETAYTFVSVERLVADFLAEVSLLRGGAL